jgi:hypothetical protein
MANSDEQERSPASRLVDGMFGVALEAQDAVAGGLAALWDVNKRVLETTEKLAAPVLAPLDSLGVTDFVRQPVAAVAEQVEGAFSQFEERGRQSINAGTFLPREVIGEIAEVIVEILTTSPAVDSLVGLHVKKVLAQLPNEPALTALVRQQVRQVLPLLVRDAVLADLIRAQVGEYMDYLRQNPEVLQTLIRSQGDRYIDYLNANPQAVQNLVQGQTTGLAGDVRDEIRERTVTGDSLAEMIVRGVLRRKPREELPPPPEEAQRRAKTHRLPSDYTQTGENGGA